MRTVDTLLLNFIKYPKLKDIRISSTYFNRENSIISKEGGMIGITELESDLRLHLHILTYPSTILPSLFTQVIPSDILSK